MRPCCFQFIVGYMGNDANASGNTMMAPTFLSVNSATGCTLADLTVTGYDAPTWNEDDEEYEGGCIGGQFILSFLTSSGTYENRYYWIDDGEIGPGWYRNAGGAAISGGAASVAIEAGKAAWVLGKGLTLQTAGQVCESDVAKVMNSTGNTASGNCMPIDLTLAKLTVSGYEEATWNEDDEEFEGGCIGGQFILSYLTSAGSYEARYYWIDDGETGPGWYRNAGGAAISGGATSISVPAGKGFWVLGKGLTLNFPAPEL